MKKNYVDINNIKIQVKDVLRLRISSSTDAQ